MADIVNSGFEALDYGIASNATDTFRSVSDLVTGDKPEIAYADYLVKAGTVIAKWSPVAVDDTTGGLVPATQGKPAIGLSMSDLAPTVDIYVNIPIGGVFNPDRIAWPASYTTDAQKQQAFAGAPTPTAIIVRKRETYSAASKI